jgi:hypothetical protein
MDNKTSFYTKGFMELITKVDGIISLNLGDKFIGENGDHYSVVWKLYNPFLNIMIYHGELTNNQVSE